MKTLFLNPPSFQGFDGGAGSRWQAKREVRSFWYPTWLAQAAALLDDSRLVDAGADGLSVEDVLDIARGYQLVILFTSTPSFPNDSAIAARIKQQAPETMIGFVGPHVSVLAEESLRTAPSVDFVIRREFDYPVKQIAQGARLGDVRGASWRDGQRIVHNPDSEIIEDLDGLPFVTDVYKRDLTIENYYIGYLLHPYISIYTGRGCPARCTYCLWPQTFSGHRYRVRGAESVYRELAVARDQFPQVKEFFIDDDTFTANPKRAEQVATEIARLGITWSTSSRANVSRDTLKMLKDSGLRLLMVGYESGSDAILGNVRKGVSTEIARRFTDDCRRLGIALHGCFVVGLPGESRETIEQTLRFAREIDPDTIQVSVAAPYPGTQLYRQAIENDWLIPDTLVASDGTQACPITYPHFTSKDILAARDMIYKRFYFRPKVMIRIGTQMLKDRNVRSRRLREGREFLDFLKHRSPSVAR